jgi:beta-galactosidase
MPDWAKVWREAGSHRRLESLRLVEQKEGRVEYVAEFSFDDDAGEAIARWSSRYTVWPNGALDIDNRFERGDGLPVVPRVGMNVELIRELDQTEWFGRGPFENYIDRNLAANVGRYSSPVSDHYVPYMRPQENGYKTDVRWLSLSDGAATGLLIQARDRIGFSVHHNRQADFIPPEKVAITSEDGPDARKSEKRVNVHVSDIVPRDLVSLNIDYGQMGVGGDDSWGP